MGRGVSLHLGLNKVDPEHYGGWSGELTACEADAEDMEGIAKARGFETELVLTDAATRPTLLSRIAKHAESLGAGDTFFLSYSGHGGQVPDVHGDEPDHLDETWCLYDGQLIDDELHMALGRFREGVRLVVLADCCHSGTSLKAAYYQGSVAERVSAAAIPDAVVRAMPPEIALRTYRLHKADYDKRQSARGMRTAKADIKASALLVSGCQDNQYSADGTFNGLFTGTLLHVWRNGGFLDRKRNTFKHLWKAVRRQMPPDQTPNYYWVGAKSPDFERSPAFTP